MSDVTQNDLASLIIQWVIANKQSNNLPNSEINEDTDLLGSGLLDSFGFVDLVLFIEEESAIKINLIDVEPSEFTVVKGLCKIALSSQPASYSTTNELVEIPRSQPSPAQ